MTTPVSKLAPIDVYALKKGDTDYLGNIIEQVYAKEHGKYIIYVTTDHQLICKGEEESVANQENINRLLLQIGDLISHNPSLKPIRRHLTRRAKLAYQAGAASVLLLSLAALLIAVRIGLSSQPAINLFVVTVFSSAGGFLSVAIGAASLSLDLHHSFFINMVYGALRIVISIISGVIVYFLIQTRILFAFLKDTTDLNGLIIVSVVAGFCEKLVPNLMSRIGHQYENQHGELETT
jgi:hypothetical protein